MALERRKSNATDMMKHIINKQKSMAAQTALKAIPKVSDAEAEVLLENFKLLFDCFGTIGEEQQMKICSQFSPVHLERLFNFQKECMIEEKEKYEEMNELTLDEDFKVRRLLEPKIDNLNGKIEGEITRITPKYFPSTDTARLQKIADIMKL